MTAKSEVQGAEGARCPHKRTDMTPCARESRFAGAIEDLTREECDDAQNRMEPHVPAQDPGRNDLVE